MASRLETSKAAAAQADQAVSRYRRAVDYLAAAQIYLVDNPLLEEPLRAEHIKKRLLGHWGTAPGINLVYSALNREILRSGAKVLLVTGPGHGAAANMTRSKSFSSSTRRRATTPCRRSWRSSSRSATRSPFTCGCDR